MMSIIMDILKHPTPSPPPKKKKKSVHLKVTAIQRRMQKIYMFDHFFNTLCNLSYATISTLPAVFQVSNGVSLSPMLFNLYINDLVLDLLTLVLGVGYSYGRLLVS